MITSGNFKKGKMVFTTHNLGMIKAAEKIKKAGAQVLKPIERITLDEAEGIGSEMKEAVLAKVVVEKAVEPVVVEKGAKRGGKKKGK